MVDAYRDYRFRSGQLASGPFDWAAVGGTSDWLAGVGMALTGSTVDSWTDQIASEPFTPFSGVQSYSTSSVNGHPGVTCLGSPNANQGGLRAATALAGTLIGTQPAPFEVIWSGSILSAPVAAAPTPAAYFGAGEVLWAFNGLRLSCKAYLDSITGDAMACVQIFNATDSFQYAICSLGPVLPAFSVLDVRHDGTDLFISEKGGAEGSNTNSGPQASTNSQPMLLHFENNGAPSFTGDSVTSRLMTRPFGARTMAAILSEVTRLS